jgi:hypothetical protein
LANRDDVNTPRPSSSTSTPWDALAIWGHCSSLVSTVLCILQRSMLCFYLQWHYNVNYTNRKSRALIKRLQGNLDLNVKIIFSYYLFFIYFYKP